ncbi:unnamed protein product, partial [marine sediment metagenome]
MRRQIIQHTTQKEWDNSFDTNVRASFLLAKHSYDFLKDNGGSIIFISTVGGLRAHHRGIPYDPSKAAIDCFVRNLAIDYGLDGIRVNAVAPGVTNNLKNNLTVKPHVRPD